jgi:hypothetical protein
LPRDLRKRQTYRLQSNIGARTRDLLLHRFFSLLTFLDYRVPGANFQAKNKKETALSDPSLNFL